VIKNWLSNRLACNKAKCLEIRNRWYPKPQWPGEIYCKEIQSRSADVLLEIGCGWRAQMLRRATDWFRWKIGIDPDCRPLPDCEPSICLLSGDAAALPLKDESVDVIALNNVVEHLAYPERVFRECNRVLRPNGTLLIFTVNRMFPPIALARFLPHKIRVFLNWFTSGTAHEDTFPALYRANSIHDLRRLGEAAGLRPVTLRYISHHPVYLLFSPIVYRAGVLIERVIRRADRLAWLRHMILARFEKPSVTEHITGGG